MHSLSLITTVQLEMKTGIRFTKFMTLSFDLWGVRCSGWMRPSSHCCTCSKVSECFIREPNAEFRLQPDALSLSLYMLQVRAVWCLSRLLLGVTLTLGLEMLLANKWGITHDNAWYQSTKKKSFRQVHNVQIWQREFLTPNIGAILLLWWHLDSSFQVISSKKKLTASLVFTNLY